MRALIQRVRHASVVVDERLVGQIDHGLLVFLGIAHGDGTAQADKLLHKILHYRIFAAADGRMNRNVQEVQGGLLLVSQFTLMADTSRGLRPGFSTAAAPVEAERLYDYFVATACRHYSHDKIATGIFAANMQVSLLNDGPVTFLLEVD